MKKILVLCLSLLMLTAFGCKSTSDGDATPASAADAKGSAAPACATIKLDPNALVAEDVAKVINSFLENLELSAKNANGDCDKLGKNLNDLLDACEENYVIAMTALMTDSSLHSLVPKPSYETFNPMAESCKDNQAFNAPRDRFTGATIRAMAKAGAVPVYEEDDEDEGDDEE